MNRFAFWLTPAVALGALLASILHTGLPDNRHRPVGVGRPVRGVVDSPGASPGIRGPAAGVGAGERRFVEP